MTIQKEQFGRHTYFWTYPKKVIQKWDLYELEDGTLLIDYVHGWRDGSLCIHPYAEDHDKGWQPVKPEDIEQLAESLGYEKWIIAPCYPDAVKARYPQIAHHVIGDWNTRTNRRTNHRWNKDDPNDLDDLRAYIAYTNKELDEDDDTISAVHSLFVFMLIHHPVYKKRHIEFERG